MPTFKITLAYDGTDYVGWQRQANGVVDPGLLEDALRRSRRRDASRCRRRAHRRRRPCARAGRVASRSSRDIDGATRRPRAERASADDVRVLAAEEVAADVSRALRARGRRPIAIASGTATCSSPFERRVRVARRRRARRRRDAAPRRIARRAPRLRGVSGGRVRRYGNDRSRTMFGIVRSTIGHPAVCSSSTRSPATAFFATWSARSSGRSSRSAAGGGRREWLACAMASRDRATAGPTAPAAGLFLVARRLRRRRACG